MKLHVPFVQLPLTFDAQVLADEVAALGEEAWRPHPTGLPGNTALTLITTDGNPDSDRFVGAMRPTRWLERCPYLMQTLSRIGATWGRTRLMRLSGQAEVTRHVDINYYWRERVRVHVPVVTWPSVRFQCGDAEVHMGTGECWIFDTWRMHRVLNGDDRARIHLVADTVGGDDFWDLVAAGRAPGRDRPGWKAEHVTPIAGDLPELDCERVNVPTIMTPWEMREHIVFLLGEASPHLQLSAVQQALLVFVRRWHALWSCYGEAEDGWPRYRGVLEDARSVLVTLGANEVALRNGVRLMNALTGCVFDVAMAGTNVCADADLRHDPTGAPAPSLATGTGASTITPVRTSAQIELDRPIFIVSPPRSGSTLLFETLMQAPQVYTIGDESHQLIEGISELDPVQRGFDSNRLLAEDATPEVDTRLRMRFAQALRDRDGLRLADQASVRMLEKTPKNALRIPFLARVFPDARFIYLQRDPRQVLSSMIEGWNSGRFRTYTALPGWRGLAWSFLLVPGWRELIDHPLEEVVAAQWQRATSTILDDLAQLPRESWTVCRYEDFMADPQHEIERLCAWADWSWDRQLGAQLPLSRYTVSPPDPEKWRRHAALIEPQLAQLQPLIDRLARI